MDVTLITFWQMLLEYFTCAHVWPRCRPATSSAGLSLFWSHAMLDSELSPLTSIYKKSNHTKLYQIYSDVSSSIKDRWGWEEGSRCLTSSSLTPIKHNCVQYACPPQCSQPLLGILLLAPVHCQHTYTQTHTHACTRTYTGTQSQ